MVDDKKVYETLDLLVEDYKSAKNNPERLQADFKMFTYINKINSVNNHKYLKYYFTNAKTKR